MGQNAICSGEKLTIPAKTNRVSRHFSSCSLFQPLEILHDYDLEKSSPDFMNNEIFEKLRSEVFTKWEESRRCELTNSPAMN